MRITLGSETLDKSQYFVSQSVTHCASGIASSIGGKSLPSRAIILPYRLAIVSVDIG